ncbi:MAG TPA: hypothetical protein VMF30_11780 [Pirellulales bacterium]|nr:hypothetical protein [Pirellulales bacterium]
MPRHATPIFSRPLFACVAAVLTLAVALSAVAAAPKPKDKKKSDKPAVEATDDAAAPAKEPEIRAKPAESLAGELVRVRPEKDRKGEHDLLDSADLAKDVLYTTDHGQDPVPETEQYQFVDGILRTPEKGDARLSFPVEVPEFYRLTIDAFLKPGAEDPEIGVCAVAGGHQFFAEMWQRKLLVSQFYGRQLFGRFIGGEYHQGDPQLHDGVELFVGPWGVLIRRQGKFFEWTAIPAAWSLDDQWRVPASDKLYICFPSGQYDVHSITLEPLDEEAWIEKTTHYVPEMKLAWGGKFRDFAQVAPDVEPLPKADELKGIILLQARRADFESLEAWAERFRKGDVMAGSEYALEILYTRVGDAYTVGSSGSHGGLEAYFQGQLGFIDEWLRQYPKSVAARIAKAQAYIAYAWDARGSEFAEKVRDEDWKIFGDRLEKAEAILEETAKLKPRDVCVFSTLLRLGKALDWDKEKMQKTAERGLQVSKKDPELIDGVTGSLLPRWGGEPGDLGKAALFFSERIKGPDGLEAFMRVVRLSHREEITLKRHLKGQSPEAYRDFTDPAVVLEEFNQAKLKAAVPVVLKRHAKSSSIRQHCCWIYCVLGDRKDAKTLFADIEKPDLAIWESEDNFDHWRQWADEKGK